MYPSNVERNVTVATACTNLPQMRQKYLKSDLRVLAFHTGAFRQRVNEKRSLSRIRQLVQSSSSS